MGTRTRPKGRFKIHVLRRAHSLTRGFSAGLELALRHRIWCAGACLLVLAALGTMLFFAFRRNAPVQEREEPVLTVTAQKVHVQPISRELSVNGSIAIWDPLSVGSEIGGLRIDYIGVEEGARVSRGQVLARLNAAILVARLQEQQARLRASRANIAKAVQPNRREDIEALRAAVAQGEANVAQESAHLAQAEVNAINARHNAKRYADLRRLGAVSDQETEAKDTQAKAADQEVVACKQKLAAARFALRQAQERAAMAQRGGRSEDIEISYANHKEIEARIRELEAQIAQTIIHAPTDGLIVKRNGHIGDIATAGQELFKMARDSRFELRAEIPEVYLPQIKEGQKVTVQLPGMKQMLLTTVRQISPSVEATTRLGTVRIDLPRGTQAKPGMFARAVIHVGSTEAVVVPAKAILARDAQSFVFVLENSHACQRFIRCGTRKDQVVEVLSGLAPGETVIVSGAGFLKDGDLVLANSIAGR